MTFWEITTYGFDGGNPELTAADDDRVLWVKAETEAQVQDVIAGTDATYEQLDYDPTVYTLDYYTLPDDASELRKALLYYQLKDL